MRGSRRSPLNHRHLGLTPPPGGEAIRSPRSIPAACLLSTSNAAAAPGPKDEPTLKEDQRKYLWEVEHHGLLLGRFGFARLAQALRRGEAADFVAVLSKSFEGQLLVQPRETRSETPGVRVVRQEDSGQNPRTLDRTQFVARLFEDRKKFSRPPQVKLCSWAWHQQAGTTWKASGKDLHDERGVRPPRAGRARSFSTSSTAW